MYWSAPTSDNTVVHANESIVLHLRRPFMDDADYTRRSNTLGANGRHGDDEFEVSTSH